MFFVAEGAAHFGQYLESPTLSVTRIIAPTPGSDYSSLPPVNPRSFPQKEML